MTPAARLLPILAALGLVWGSTAAAVEPPTPPCAGAAATPAFPRPGAPPAVAVWRADALPDGWAPPACSGLAAARRGTTVVALAGAFRAAGGLDAVLARLGAVSRQTGIRYWRVQDQAWVPMLDDASALAGADASARREDFAPAELRQGARLHALYDDSDPIGPVVYETEVLAVGPTSVRLVTRNVTPGRMMGFTIADPGDLASMLEIDAAGGDAYRYYALTTVTLGSLAAALVPDAAHVNRAVATFRFVAGIPTDAEPPAAPGPPPAAAVPAATARSRDPDAPENSRD